MKSSDPLLDGYVLKIMENEVLVVSKKPENIIHDGKKDIFFQAHCVSDIPFKVDIGDRIQVWGKGPYEFIYPGRIKANKCITSIKL